MSVSNTTSKAGPYSANGAQTTFAFAFKAFSKNDLRVVLTTAAALESDLTVDSQFTVSLNADQNASPGGSISTSVTYATGYLITVVSNLTPNQLVSLTNFRPDVIEKAFDKITLLVQQLFEKTSRAVTVNISSTLDPQALINSLISSAAAASTAASSSSDSAVLSASYASASSASAAAALVSKNAAGLSETNTATSAGTATTQAGIATTQAGISTTQAGIATAKAVLTAADVVTTAASQAAALASKNAAGVSEANALTSANAAALSYDSFDDRYLGAKTVDPTLDNDGAALLVGALYFNSASNSMRVYSGVAWQSTNLTAIADAIYFRKPLPQAHCFTKTGAGAIAILAGTDVTVAGLLVSFSVQTAVVMPALTSGTDYAIYVCTDSTIRADASFTAPSGYTALTSRQIGGFHYAPGGVATAQAGGDTTPAINAFSIWDLKFKPDCADPRGMALIAGHFWADIYLLGVDYLTNGSSKYNVTIADGSAPPKRSTLYGGNGTTTYADGNWWNLAEALRHVGKRHPTYSEFAALAYGTTEAVSSGGSDVPTTGVSGTGATSAWNLFTSKFGIIQASGNLWVWGDEFGGGAAAAGWTANTQGRGNTYQMENAALFGGRWAGVAFSGSRASLWGHSAADSNASFGARGVCDHLTLV